MCPNRLRGISAESFHFCAGHASTFTFCLCKWCASYASKVERIDSLLLRKKFGTDFEDSEIEAFKEDIKKESQMKRIKNIIIPVACFLTASRPGGGGCANKKKSRV